VNAPEDLVDEQVVGTTVAELSAMFEGDGAALRVAEIDQWTGTVRLVLSLADVSCADCVLPPDRLQDVVTGALRRAEPGVRSVVVDDPRETALAGAATLDAQVIVLDPTGAVPAGNADPGPTVGQLAGRRVGFRVDVLWPAWDAVVDEWARELEAAGATVTRWRRRQGLKGAEGDRAQADYEAFIGTIDVLVSGLGNCGSCTSWSVRDGLEGLNTGLPTVVAVTEHFEALARTLATDLGRPGLRLIVLPFSAHTLPDAEVRAAARERYPALLEVLGAAAAVPAGAV
jgi:Fe-S cluster biogenesis protein NfuA